MNCSINGKNLLKVDNLSAKNLCCFFPLNHLSRQPFRSILVNDTLMALSAENTKIRDKYNSPFSSLSLLFTFKPIIKGLELLQG